MIIAFLLFLVVVGCLAFDFISISFFSCYIRFNTSIHKMILSFQWSTTRQRKKQRSKLTYLHSPLWDTQCSKYNCKCIFNSVNFKAIVRALYLQQPSTEQLKGNWTTLIKQRHHRYQVVSLALKCIKKQESIKFILVFPSYFIYLTDVNNICMWDCWKLWKCKIALVKSNYLSILWERFFQKLL